MAAESPIRRSYSQACPVAHSLDLVGERWTLLIVRDLMFGPLSFGDLLDGLPGLARNLLAERLRFLDEAGILERVPAPPPPAGRHLYALTPRGRELAPVVHELARFGVSDWADPDVDPPPRRLLRGALLALMAPERLGDHSWSAIIHLSGTSVRVSVGPADERHSSPLRRLHLTEDAEDSAEAGDLPADAELHCTLGTLVALRRGDTSLDRAMADGSVSVDGDQPVLEQLAALFGWA